MNKILDALHMTYCGAVICIQVQGIDFEIEEDTLLYDALKEEMERSESSFGSRAATPVTAQTGQRQRFRNPIQANTTAAGKIEADYGDYSAIEQRILNATNNKVMAQSNRTLLNEERVFIMEKGNRLIKPAPVQLYEEDTLFREFVDQCILWQQQNAQNSSSRVSVAAIIKTICNYIRPKSGWIDWKLSRLISNEPIPVEAAKPVKVEVIQPRGAPTSQG